MLYENGIYSPFGPSIGIYDLKPETLSAFKDIAKNVRTANVDDAGKYLAGIIEEQYDITTMVNQELMNDIFESATDYFDKRNQPEFPFACDGIWMNIQKPHEVNPPHEHTGILSFVAYVQSGIEPEDCTNNPHDKRNQHDETRKQVGGILEFRYGTASYLNNHVFEFFPKEGKVIFFPSWLTHMVMPFYKEGVERISVAGNISLYEPNDNNDKKL